MKKISSLFLVLAIPSMAMDFKDPGETSKKNEAVAKDFLDISIKLAKKTAENRGANERFIINNLFLCLERIDVFRKSNDSWSNLYEYMISGGVDGHTFAKDMLEFESSLQEKILEKLKVVSIKNPSRLTNFTSQLSVLSQQIIASYFNKKYPETFTPNEFEKALCDQLQNIQKRDMIVAIMGLLNRYRMFGYNHL